MTLQDKLEELKQQLDQQRDELIVQMNLAKMEVQQDWEKAEEQMEHFRTKLMAAGDEAKDAAGDVLQSSLQLGEEIHRAYQRIKSKL